MFGLETLAVKLISGLAILGGLVFGLWRFIAGIKRNARMEVQNEQLREQAERVRAAGVAGAAADDSFLQPPDKRNRH